MSTKYGNIPRPVANFLTGPPSISTKNNIDKNSIMRTFFGEPSNPAGMGNANDGRPETTFNLPAAWVGKSEQWGDSIALLSYTADNFLTRIICPVQKTELNSYQWRVTEFSSKFNPITPLRGRTRCLEVQTRSGAGAFLRRGIGIQMEHGFMMTEMGRQYLMAYFEQMVQSVIETNNFGVIHALITCHNPDAEPSRTNQTYTPYLVGNTRERELFLFAIMQQNSRPLNALNAYVDSELAHAGGKADTWIFPEKISLFSTLAIPAYLEYYRNGFAGPSIVKNGVNSFYTMPGMDGTKMYTTTAFDIYGTGPINMLRNPVEYGEYYPAVDTFYRNWDRYHSDWRSIASYDETTNTWQKFGLDFFVEHCNRFDNKNGLPWDIDDMAFSRGNTADGFTEAERDIDVFRTEGNKNDIINVKYFGQIRQQYLPAEVIHGVAQTALAAMRDVPQDAGEINRILTNGFDHLNYLESLPYDQNVENFLLALARANHKNGTEQHPGVDDLPPLSSILEWTPNNNSALNLPMLDRSIPEDDPRRAAFESYANKFTLPPTFGSFAGFQTIADAYQSSQENFNAIYGFNTSAAKSIHEFVHLIRRVSIHISTMFPDSVVNSKAYASSWWHRPTPAHVLFESILNTHSLPFFLKHEGLGTIGSTAPGAENVRTTFPASAGFGNQNARFPPNQALYPMGFELQPNTFVNEKGRVDIDKWREKVALQTWTDVLFGLYVLTKFISVKGNTQQNYDQSEKLVTVAAILARKKNIENDPQQIGAFRAALRSIIGTPPSGIPYNSESLFGKLIAGTAKPDFTNVDKHVDKHFDTPTATYLKSLESNLSTTKTNDIDVFVSEEKSRSNSPSSYTRLLVSVPSSSKPSTQQQAASSSTAAPGTTLLPGAIAQTPPPPQSTSSTTRPSIIPFPYEADASSQRRPSTERKDTSSSSTSEPEGIKLRQDAVSRTLSMSSAYLESLEANVIGRMIYSDEETTAPGKLAKIGATLGETAESIQSLDEDAISQILVYRNDQGGRSQVSDVDSLYFLRDLPPFVRPRSVGSSDPSPEDSYYHPGRSQGPLLTVKAGDNITRIVSLLPEVIAWDGPGDPLERDVNPDNVTAYKSAHDRLIAIAHNLRPAEDLLGDAIAGESRKSSFAKFADAEFRRAVVLSVLSLVNLNETSPTKSRYGKKARVLTLTKRFNDVLNAFDRLTGGASSRLIDGDIEVPDFDVSTFLDRIESLAQKDPILFSTSVNQIREIADQNDRIRERHIEEFDQLLDSPDGRELLGRLTGSVPRYQSSDEVNNIPEGYRHNPGDYLRAPIVCTAAMYETWMDYINSPSGNVKVLPIAIPADPENPEQPISNMQANILARGSNISTSQKEDLKLLVSGLTPRNRDQIESSLNFPENSSVANNVRSWAIRSPSSRQARPVSVIDANDPITRLIANRMDGDDIVTLEDRIARTVSSTSQYEELDRQAISSAANAKNRRRGDLIRGSNSYTASPRVNTSFDAPYGANELSSLLQSRAVATAHKVAPVDTEFHESINPSFRIHYANINTVVRNNLERMVARAFLFTPVSKKALHSFASNNIVMPFSFHLVKPHISHFMLSAIKVFAGKETGVTWMGPSEYSWGNDAGSQNYLGSFVYNAITAIKTPKNVFIASNIFCDRYIRGNGSKPFIRGKDTYRPEADIYGEGSVFVFMGPYTETDLPNPWNITGRSRINGQNIQDVPENNRIHASFAYFYNSFWGFLARDKQNTHNEAMLSYMYDTSVSNTEVWRGAYKTWQKYQQQLSDLHRGTGHWKETDIDSNIVRAGALTNVSREAGIAF